MEENFPTDVLDCIFEDDGFKFVVLWADQSVALIRYDELMDIAPWFAKTCLMLIFGENERKGLASRSNCSGRCVHLLNMS